KKHKIIFYSPSSVYSLVSGGSHAGTILVVTSIRCRISVHSCAETVETGVATADSKARDVIGGGLNMSKAKILTLRVQSPEGTKRIEVRPSDTILDLFEKVNCDLDIMKQKGMPRVRYTLEQRRFVCDTYMRKKSIEMCRRKFRRKYPGITVPHKSTIQHLVKKVCETGSFSDKKINRRRTVITQENLNDIAYLLENSPNKSLSKLAQHAESKGTITYRWFGTQIDITKAVQQQMTRITHGEADCIRHLPHCWQCVVHETFGLSGYGFALYRQRGCKDELISSRSKTVRSYGLSHGDMLYLTPLNGAMLWSQETSPKPSTSSGISNSNNTPSGEPVLVDTEQRPSVSLQEDEMSSWSKWVLGKFVSLEDISCRIKTGCKDHPPWPKGICSKCQPNAITLNRQVYRHVDNVMFENAHLVERFLNYWRSTGHQRIGFLYGKYENHTDVPLGIRARVAAIYEPPQESTRDSITLLPDDKETLVQELALQLGLRRVGWIFTDLVADDVKKGTVKHVRNIESHFLSSEECIMAGHYQNQQPNPCRFSPVGYFGSKFVTVCVTGDASNQVHMEGYQVSNQCMALVRDNCLVPTKDAPELGYVRESTDKQFVPDVYYKVRIHVIIHMNVAFRDYVI
ncbi:Nuclear protein localization protein 4, partial [Blattella germanica]